MDSQIAVRWGFLLNYGPAFTIRLKMEHPIFFLLLQFSCEGQDYSYSLKNWFSTGAKCFQNETSDLLPDLCKPHFSHQHLCLPCWVYLIIFHWTVSVGFLDKRIFSPNNVSCQCQYICNIFSVMFSETILAYFAERQIQLEKGWPEAQGNSIFKWGSVFPFPVVLFLFVFIFIFFYVFSGGPVFSGHEWIKKLPRKIIMAILYIVLIRVHSKRILPWFCWYLRGDKIASLSNALDLYFITMHEYRGEFFRCNQNMQRSHMLCMFTNNTMRSGSSSLEFCSID